MRAEIFIIRTAEMQISRCLACGCNSVCTNMQRYACGMHGPHVSSRSMATGEMHDAAESE